MRGIDGRLCRVALVLALMLPLGAAPRADDAWKPFRDIDEARARERAKAKANASTDDRPFLPPMSGDPSGARRQDGSSPQPYGSQPYQPGPQPYAQPDGQRPAWGAERTDPRGDTRGASLRDLPPPDEKSRGIERGDLAPAMAADGSGLPQEPWAGLDIARVEGELGKLELPPRSPALGRLLRRLLVADVVPPSGVAPDQFDAFRLDLLLRAGMPGAMRPILDRATPAGSPLVSLVRARSALALGDRDAACTIARELGQAKVGLEKPLKGEAILLSGYCALATGNPGGGGMMATLAREEGVTRAHQLAALDAAALGGKPDLGPKPGRISLIDYRFIEAAGGADLKTIAEAADAALLATLALDANVDIRVRVAAAEAAIRQNGIEADELATVYRAVPAGDAARPDPLLRRAQLFQQAEAERTPLKQARAVRAFLDDARRTGFYLPALQIAAKPVSGMQITPEIGWFAETAVETLLAADRYTDARSVVASAQGVDRAGGDGLAHWLALIDIADAAQPARRGDSLASLEPLALRGRFSGDLLHRLATVLDALDYNVPIPLWDAANRAPRPKTGHLPETGVLSELQDASKKKQVGRTALLAMRALGPTGAEGADLIALGDAIRAVKRAGLDQDARRIGLEALFAGWPRTAAP